MEREKHIRPWGNFEILATGPGYKVKRLVVDPGKRTSLQRHGLRGEDWVIVSGSGEVTARFEESSQTYPARYQSHHFLPKTMIHRIHNTGTEPLVIIEVQTFDADNLSGEDDIHRLEDDYGRVKDGE